MAEIKTITTDAGTYDSFPDKTAREALSSKLPAPESPTVGYYLRVKAINEDGTISVESAPAPTNGSVELPSTAKFEMVAIGAADTDGVYIQSEGTAEAPTLDLYGENGDEPVRLRNLAEAVDDSDAPTLAQVREMIGTDSGENLSLDSTLTVSGAAADAKATGDEIKRVEGLIPSIEGLAKSEDIPTKPEDIGAQPKGDYLTQAPVTSVNGKTGAVELTAEDVGALPDTYTPPDQTAEQVGADAKGTAAALVSGHDTDTAAHQHLVLEIQHIRTQLAAFFDADEETLNEMSELIAAIVANRGTIAELTAGKVNVSDIVDNLVTNVTNKPLSAAQGVALKLLIDNLSASLANYQPKGDYPLRSELPFVPTNVSAFTNDAGYLTEHQDISGLAAKFDPTVYGLPVLYLTGDISPIRVSKDNKVTLDYVYGERSGTCTLKGQGDSSYANAQALGDKGKFNYTIKFDEAFEAVSGWSAQNKYCLKANFIDPTHARNVVTAKLWGQAVKSRVGAPAEFTALPNGGAIDGFPIVIMLNGEFHGLYTFNIPKDAWMFGLVEDTTKTQAIVCANKESDPVLFKAEALLDESDYELEFVSDENNVDWVLTSLNRLIRACIDSDGSDLDTTIAQYLDWNSAIDYYIFTVILGGSDLLDKNFLLVTLDGTKWYFSAYDMDTTYGMKWDGTKLRGYDYDISFVKCAATHRVFELIKRFKTDALKARYEELRTSVWFESNVYQMFENFAWSIPSPLYLEDVKRWPSILGSAVTGIDQILRWCDRRFPLVDKWKVELPAQETPSEPDEESKGNLVPTSIDVDGSIYNGTGYKDDTRLSSSGDVSSSAQTGSVTTGFMEWTPMGVIRMKGAKWVGMSTTLNGTHWYVIFYSDDKSIHGSAITSASYGSGGYNGITVSYDEATDITTFDFSTSVSGTNIGNAVREAAYFRINAYGKGADLIVTVNEEITE